MKRSIFLLFVIIFSLFSLIACEEKDKCVEFTVVQLADSSRMSFDENNSYGSILAGDLMYIAKSQKKDDKPSQLKWHISDGTEKNSITEKVVVVRKVKVSDFKKFSMIVFIENIGGYFDIYNPGGFEEGDIVRVTMRTIGSGTIRELEWHLENGAEDENFVFSKATVTKIFK